jgi:mutS2 family protein
MDKKYLIKLEYDKILDILSNYACCYLGKNAILSLKPSIQKDEVLFCLSQTAEAVTLLYRKGVAPISDIADIKISLKSLASNLPLSAKSLLEVNEILKTARLLKEYFFSEAEKTTSSTTSSIDLSNFPLLSELFSTLYTNLDIEKKIFHDILDENTINDDASTNLKRIRKLEKTIESTIKEKLTSMLHSSTYSKYIMEPIITIRNDRYVIPVKEEYRGMIKGFIHDISSSGSTVFIEPLTIFELNNKISSLKIEENIEIDKILKDLSALLSPLTNFLESNLTLIGQLDFIFAKAKYAKEINGILPILNDEKFFHLIQARHPLIPRENVVPIDIELGKDYSSLVITGPNTGGKTVTLKTVGLLSLMAQSGLFIPAKENSSIYIFDQIFADIGDEQSISESLSTFSSHMLNVTQIIQKATSNSLVLLDELGSGTDPIEGSSLAISILEHFYQSNVLTISTTHYHELKTYALVTNGFKNASVEFDVEHLKPTYKLLIGIPGKSNAFAISRKLGLKEEILQKASTLISQDSQSMEEVLKRIYDDKIKIEKEKEEIEKNLNQIQLLRKQLEKDNTLLEEQEKQIIEKAKIQAREILLSAKEEANDIIKELNTLSASSQSNKVANQLRNQLNEDIKKTTFSKNNTSATSLSKENVKVGLNVFISTLQRDGVILSLPNKSNEVLVGIGNAKMNLKLKDLLLSKNPTTKSLKKEININNNKNTNTNLKSKSVSSEINVIGYNVEEAIYVIDKFLDDAAISNLPTVRIVHGKGTGALRSGIHQYLKTNAHVNSFRLGTYGEGEMGVTVVELK